MKTITTPLPLSLYIHTPWCMRKCPYCDFNSHAIRGELPEENYRNTLIKDLTYHLPRIQSQEIQSIFIGGGTPSLLSAKFYETLFNQLQNHLYFSSNIEITLEANPGAVEQTRFKDYRNSGINRLSLGVQSLQDDKLHRLGRIHSSKEAMHAVDIAINAGFYNFNIDIMHGLPGQTVQDALFDLQTAIDLNPKHLSWYQLTLEPNTYFHKFPPQLPHDDLVAEIQQQGYKQLNNYGFEHYEVSAFAKANYSCRHNINYWEFGDYLGIGAGAHSKLTDIHTNTITRHWNVKNPNDYLNAKQSFVANKKIITQQELALEFMMNALRLQKPIPVSLFTERTGLDLQAIKTQLDSAHQQKLLVIDNTHFVVTSQGKRYLNELLELFL